jgi:hypothetical protein
MHRSQSCGSEKHNASPPPLVPRPQTKEPQLKPSSTGKILLFLGAGVLLGYLAWRVVPEYFRKEEDPRSQEYLSRIAAEINRSGPVMIDKETEMLPAAGAHAMLIYNYRLVSYSVAQVDHRRFAAGAKQRVVQGACSRPETADDFLKKGVTLRYSYFDKDKQHIATVEVTPADCGF